MINSQYIIVFGNRKHISSKDVVLKTPSSFDCYNYSHLHYLGK